MICASVPLQSCGTEGALVLGNSCLEGGSPQLAALSQASGSWSLLNFLGLKTLPGTLLFSPHFSSELLQNWMPSLELFKYLSSGSEYTSVDFYFVRAPQPIKGGFNELKRMLSKYFIIGKLFEGKKKRRKKNVHDFFLQRLTGNQIPLTPKTPTFE